MNRSDLHNYQTRAVEFIIDNPKSFCILGLGLGKTVSTLTAVSDLLEGFMVNRVLVIAPKRVAKYVWPEESKKWGHLSGLNLADATGTPKHRQKAIESGAPVVVINRENVPWLVGLYGKKWPFDMVVVDESTSFKASSSQRFKALKKILPQVERMVLLTATPTPNSYLELWAQVYLLDQGAALGRTFSGFRSTFFNSDYMGFNWELKPGAKERIEERIRPYVLSMRTEDYLELPSMIEQEIPVDIGAGPLKKYKELEKEFLADIAGQEVTAANAAVLCGKLQQAAHGALYTEDGGVVLLHNAKLDALEELVEQAGEPVLVAYTFKSDLARIKARIPGAVDVKDPGGAIADWNAGRIPVLCAHPASAGHGLNLQAGGSILIWFGQVWSGELAEQMPGRLHRQGQRKMVRVFRLVATGTIDERIHAAVVGKGLSQKQFVEGMSCHV